MEKKAVAVKDLDLDVSNPRINPASSQAEALGRVIEAESSGDDVGRKLLNLAKSIAEEGFDESERLIVMPNVNSSDRYIVLDGNRRLSALRLLTMPNIAARDDLGISVAVRKRLAKLQESLSPGFLPITLDVIAYPDRKSAKEIIHRKHSGELEGAGRSAWEAFQERRFSNSGAYQLLMELMDSGLLNQETMLQISRGDYVITNFERVVETEAFTDLMGASIRHSGMNLGNSSNLALRAAAEVANEVATGAITSRKKIENTEKIRDYLSAIKAKLQVPVAPPGDAVRGGVPGEQKGEGLVASNHPGPEVEAQPEASPGAGDSPQARPAEERGPAEPRPAAPPRTRTSPYLIKQGDAFRTGHPKCDALIAELSSKGKIRVGDAPYACSHLIRSLLEITALEYVQVFSLVSGSNKTTVIQALGQDLIAHARMKVEPNDRKDLGGALLRSAGAYDGLSEVAHNPRMIIDEGHVRATWGTVGPALKLAWDRITSKKHAAGQQR